MFIYIKNRELNTRKCLKATLPNKVSGFTLIELMVAISIFMIIMTMAMGSLLITLDAKKKSEVLGFTMDNLNFAMESMTRSLRMGTNYDCEGIGLNCLSNGKGVIFNPSKSFIGANKLVTYSIRKRTASNTYTIKRCVESDCVDIITDNINIEYGNSFFYVKGSGRETNGQQVQPSIYIKIVGSVTVKDGTIPFAIQTMVSQRRLDF